MRPSASMVTTGLNARCVFRSPSPSLLRPVPGQRLRPAGIRAISLGPEKASASPVLRRRHRVVNSLRRSRPASPLRGSGSARTAGASRRGSPWHCARWRTAARCAASPTWAFTPRLRGKAMTQFRMPLQRLLQHTGVDATGQLARGRGGRCCSMRAGMFLPRPPSHRADRTPAPGML